MSKILYIFVAEKPSSVKKKRYIVYVQVAPYVARYLIDNFGVRDPEVRNLVDIRGDQAMMAFFTPRIRQRRYDKRIEARNVGFRTEKVGIVVSPSSYSRHGWALSATDEAAFARMLELRCQGILLTYLQAHYMVSGCVADAIQSFYKTFHMNDEIWPYDSIRKIWNRNVENETKQTLKSEIYVKIQHQILVQLSTFGTISQKGLQLYENH